jgi:hypothetical protein
MHRHAGKTLSVQTLNFLDGKILMPSKIGAERRQSLSAKFHVLRLPEGGTPGSQLLFRSSPQLLLAAAPAAFCRRGTRGRLPFRISERRIFVEPSFDG